MRFITATIVYATIFALICFFSQVFSDELYCFSCFGFDQDDPNKCKTYKDNNLVIRKCTTNATEKPRCIKYTADYTVPQMHGQRLTEDTFKVHGVHCGTLRQCTRNDCPNFWPNDVKAKNCKVECCNADDIPDEDPSCPGFSDFPVPNEGLITKDNDKKKAEKSGLAVAGQRSSDAATTGWHVWLQAVSFAIFGWFKL